MAPFTVLVAIDLSASSVSALTTAQELATRLAPAHLHLLYVIDTLTPLAALAPGSANDGASEGVIPAAERALLAFAEAHGATVGVVCEAVAGQPARVVVERARALASDLVIVGCMGRSGANDDFFGATASYALRHAPCPVLMARSEGAPTDRELEPPCPACIETRQSSELNHAYCERHMPSHHEQSLVALDSLGHRGSAAGRSAAVRSTFPPPRLPRAAAS